MDFPTQEEIDRWRMCIADEELFGKNDDSFELRLPAELKAALARKGAQENRSAAAVARLAMVLYVFGPEHVGMIVARRYGLAQQAAPDAVRTNAGQAVS